MVLNIHQIAKYMYDILLMALNKTWLIGFDKQIQQL